MTGVYTIKCLVTQKVYVGSAAKCLASRFRQHRYQLGANKSHCKHLQSAWNKYGKSRFRFFVLEECAPEDCLTREQHWIDHFKAHDRNYGFNTRPVAESNRGMKWSEESRRKMSESAKLRCQRPEERARMLRQSLEVAKDKDAIERQASKRRGFKHTPEAKAAIAAYQRGRKKSPESIAKTVASQTGRKMSEEQKQFLSQIKTGKKHSPETRAKMSAAHQLRIYGE